MVIDIVRINNKKLSSLLLFSPLRNFAYDNQIRNDLAELYQIMFHINRPNCLPPLNEVKFYLNN